MKIDMAMSLQTHTREVVPIPTVVVPIPTHFVPIPLLSSPKGICKLSRYCSTLLNNKGYILCNCMVKGMQLLNVIWSTSMLAVSQGIFVFLSYFKPIFPRDWNFASRTAGIPQTLTQSPWDSHSFYPHSCGNTTRIFYITAVLPGWHYCCPLPHVNLYLQIDKSLPIFVIKVLGENSNCKPHVQLYVLLLFKNVGRLCLMRAGCVCDSNEEISAYRCHDKSIINIACFPEASV